MRESRGVELMRQIQDGRIEVAPSAYLEETRTKVSEALEELLDVGARIRPLIVDGRRVGWVRGVHMAERKALKRWITNDTELLEHILTLGSTLPVEEVRDLTLIELRSLARLIHEMSLSDLRLYSFVNPFTTTGVSEQLWYSQGTALSAFRDKWVDLPDGKRLRVTTAPDQARLWATLCNYRIQAKARLEGSMNALMTIRPHVGKGADPIAADLKAISRSLQTDSIEPWRETVKYRKDTDFNDGWAHSEDDSREGILRELHNMVSNDKHEQVMQQFDEQERQRAEKRKQEIDRKIAQRGGPGFIQSSTTPMTKAQVAARASSMKQGSLRPIAFFDQDSETSPVDRLAKYR
jgi:hypothetical protein